jgi:Sulfotransferase domain
MTMPNFIIVGAVKAGTSSIFRYMRQHPDIFTSTPKEPLFFLFNSRPPDFQGPGDREAYRNVVVDPAQYAALFVNAGGKKAIGEASASYLDGEDVPRRIADRIPDAKIIMVLRNPIERAYSHYWMFRLSRREKETFARALDMEQERRRMNWSPAWQYSRIGFYAEHVSRYLSFFSRSQCFIALYDDLDRDPVTFMRRIFEFLDVDPGFVPDMDVKYNVAGESDSRLVNFLLTSRHPIRQAIRDSIPPNLRYRLTTRLRQRYLRKPEMPAECRERLQSMYQGDIFKLEKRLDRSLAGWLRSQR